MKIPTKLSKVTSVAALKPKAVEVVDDSDPIGQCLAARQGTKDFNAPMSDADIKKSGVKGIKTPKLQLPKGKPAEEDFTAPAKKAESGLKKPSERPATAAKNARPVTASIQKTTSTKASSVQNAEFENLSEVDDPIAQCTQDRLKHGGLATNLTDAEAKAKKVKVVKVQKIITGNKATAPFVDFTEGQKSDAGASPDKKKKGIPSKMNPADVSFDSSKDKKKPVRRAPEVNSSRSGPVKKESN